MSKSKFGYQDVIKLLIKRAEGFYYTEEQFEYEKTQNKSKSNELSYLKIENISFFDNCVRGENKKQIGGDKIKSSNGDSQISNENLTLVKKKVSTHYISPDMLAIKILFEIFREKVNSNEIDSMTDEELFKLKDELLKELKDES